MQSLLQAKGLPDMGTKLSKEDDLFSRYFFSTLSRAKSFPLIFPSAFFLNFSSSSSTSRLRLKHVTQGMRNKQVNRNKKKEFLGTGSSDVERSSWRADELAGVTLDEPQRGRSELLSH